ncbi:MAG: putative tRNA dimethylallyltransferase [Streblomastix strix]|uniref:Putative tRNA dimethylallyltransferase n=1 Tax=Streblomastix strix TaxID=222440 RepID=A0A5J4V1Y9_9EUKA|nr:MAG: putative tRNA dimethylallyltransferase [Streblomastix strix]
MAARIVCIIGSTGTGKSALAISLAERFNGEIINADAMQCYIGLPISTNKPTIIEMKGIPHHLINFLPPPNTRNDHFMVLDYIRLADEVIDGIIKRGRLPIIVGGTHYYIEALLKRDFDSIQQENDEDEDKIKEQPKKDEKHEYESIKSDSFTIIKKDFPSQDERKRPQLDRHLDIKPLLKGGRFPYNSLVLWLSSESDINRLGQKLDERVDAMIERGLQNEIIIMLYGSKIMREFNFFYIKLRGLENMIKQHVKFARKRLQGQANGKRIYKVDNIEE